MAKKKIKRRDRIEDFFGIWSEETANAVRKSIKEMRELSLKEQEERDKLFKER